MEEEAVGEARGSRLTQVNVQLCLTGKKNNMRLTPRRLLTTRAVQDFLSLPRRELQDLAKAAGIRANQKSVDLAAALEKAHLRGTSASSSYLNAARLWSLRNADPAECLSACRSSFLLQLSHLALVSPLQKSPEARAVVVDPVEAALQSSDFALAKQELQATASLVLSDQHTALNFAGDEERFKFLSGLYFTTAGLDCAMAVESSQAKKGATIVTEMDGPALRGLLSHTMEDIAAFSREKHGVSPEIEVRVDEQAEGGSSRVVQGHVHFIVAELLKNAVVSMVKRYGILDVEDAPPVEVTASWAPQPGGLVLRVRDDGQGIGEGTVAAAEELFAFGATNSRSQKEDQWRHSREFGAAMSGQGVGLPRSRVFAAFNNGSLRHVPSLNGGSGGGGACFELRIP